MIAAAVDPSLERHSPANIGDPQRAAVDVAALSGTENLWVVSVVIDQTLSFWVALNVPIRAIAAGPSKASRAEFSRFRSRDAARPQRRRLDPLPRLPIEQSSRQCRLMIRALSGVSVLPITSRSTSIAM